MGRTKNRTIILGYKPRRWGFKAKLKRGLVFMDGPARPDSTAACVCSLTSPSGSTKGGAGGSGGFASGFETAMI